MSRNHKRTDWKWLLHAILLFMLLQQGCTNPSIESLASVPVDGSISMESLKQLEASADSRAELEMLLQAWLSLDEDPEDRLEIRTRSSSILLLLGAAHSRNKSEQRAFFRQAGKMAVAAMSEVPEFASALESGQTVPQAAETLPAYAFEPLMLWSTAIFYTFRDVASLPERILFKRRLQAAARVLEIMIRREPEWSGGSLQFSLGIYYLSVPEFMGGDRQLARQLMDEAVAMGDKRLLPRWGRAKYLAVALGDKELYLRDLQWVRSQDISQLDGPTIWNRYFKKDAESLLEKGMLEK